MNHRQRVKWQRNKKKNQASSDKISMPAGLSLQFPIKSLDQTQKDLYLSWMSGAKSKTTYL